LTIETSKITFLFKKKINFSFWQNFAVKRKAVDHKVHEHDVNLINFIGREHKKKGGKSKKGHKIQDHTLVVNLDNIPNKGTHIKESSSYKGTYSFGGTPAFGWS